MKVAIVHDYLIQLGGAERVLKALTEIWPEADIFTLIVDEELREKLLGEKGVKTSFLQKWPGAVKRHRLYPMLMPLAVEQFDLGEYDLVISSSASYAKGVVTKADTVHVCYCHTPMRYAWDDCHKYVREFDYARFLKKLVPFGMNYIRMWDDISADRPDYYVANSNYVKERIKKYYKREAEVIYPPVLTEQFGLSEENEGYFLMLGRLLPYKRCDLGVEAFNELGWPLKIVGVGPELDRLKKMAKPNIEFVGWVDEKKLSEYYEKCKAFVFPGEEDFGIVMMEAMACGKSVVAFGGGGALEAVEDRRSGILFKEQTKESLISALKEFEETKGQYMPRDIREQALGFNDGIFKEKMYNFVTRVLKEKHGK